ncbi:hypothetical protein VPHD81_0079 [Vibrio phage D81]
MSMAPTDTTQFLGDLTGGVFEQQLAHMLSDVALGVVLHKKKGEVTVKFKIAQIADSSQVTIDHEVTHKTPTKRGTKGETVGDQTPMFVAKGGAMSVMPPETNALLQMDAFTERK